MTQLFAEKKQQCHPPERKFLQIFTIGNKYGFVSSLVKFEKKSFGYPND
jgi:hypothetical protein